MPDDNLDPIPVTPGRAELVDIYMRALERLKSILTGEDMTLASKTYAANQIREIQKHIKSLKRDHAEWAARYIKKAYEIGTYQDEKLLKRFLGNKYQSQFSMLHREAAHVAVIGAAQDFDTVADALENTFVGYVQRAQVEGARRAIAQEIAGGIVEGAGRQTVSNRLLAVMKDNVNGGLITVGKVTMNARAYADLLARTLSRSARTDGTINRLNQNGLDLVIISNTGAVDFCIQYEDQIFSISGQSRRFPKLVARPPYHPNCTHTLSAWIEEYAEDGEAERGSQFKQEDLNLSAKEMAKKYPIVKDDTRARTKRTQKKAAA